MRILFVNPRYGGVDGLIILPLDQASTVAYCLENGIEAEVVDLAFDSDDKRLIRQISIGNYDLVLFTAITVCYRTAISAAEKIKQAVPDLPVAIMGEHVTFRKQETLLRHSCFDYVISHEAEVTTAELVTAICEEHELKEIQGLSYRANGQVVSNKDRSPVPDLNQIPIPAKHLYNLSAYLERDLETTQVTTRGCTHRCLFCHRSRYGRTHRSWSLNRVINEIEYNLSLGFNSIFFQDDVFCFDTNRTRHLCENIIERDLDFQWNCNVRVDDLSPANPEHVHLVAIMKESGCYRIFVGIESFSQETLDLNHKQTRVNQVKNFVKLFQDNSIGVHASYVIGFPGDTEEQARRNVELAIALNTEMASFNRIFPHPGTEIGDNPDSVGIVIPDQLWYEKDYWIKQAVAGNTNMSPEKVYEIQQYALQRYAEALFGE